MSYHGEIENYINYIFKIIKHIENSNFTGISYNIVSFILHGFIVIGDLNFPVLTSNMYECQVSQ